MYRRLFWCFSHMCSSRPPHAYSRQIIRYIFVMDHFVTSGLTIFRLPQLAITLDMNSRQIIHIWHCYICRDFLRQFGFHMYCMFIVVDLTWTALYSSYCHSQVVIFAGCLHDYWLVSGNTLTKVTSHTEGNSVYVLEKWYHNLKTIPWPSMSR